MSTDPVGTLYVTPDGEPWRLDRYERDAVQEFRADDPADVPARPVYSPVGSFGGSAFTGLPEGAVRVWIPTPERPARNSLFIDPATGDAYRHGGYTTDWEATDWDSDGPVIQKPNQYGVSLGAGRFTNRSTLPEGAYLAWTPGETS